jgi:hypothetical protein
MSRAAYNKRTCRCGREISAAGCAWHNHMMAHVRREEAGINSVRLNSGEIYREFYWIKEPAKYLPVNPVLNPRTYNP